MAAKRTLYLDRSAGESRGAVFLDGLPERLLIERDGPASRLQPGAMLVARVVRIEKGLGLAFLESDLGEAMVCARAALPDGAPQGSVLTVQVTAEARRDKAATVKVLGREKGAPRFLQAAPDLVTRLRAFAPEIPVEEGRDARAAIDEAEAAIFEIEFPLPGGARLTMEPTRALIAVDIDVGSAAGQDARFSATKVNQIGLAEAARLARLKGLGGLMVVDLAGKGHNGPLLVETAKAAFAPDQPGVALGAISRFGVMEIALPWRARPRIELLGDAHGAPNLITQALRLMRAIEQEAGPGRRVEARVSPALAAAAEPLKEALIARIGPRFSFKPDEARADARWEAVSL